MKAIIATRYGQPEVLEIRDVSKPTPGPGDVLVRIHATTVTSGDVRTRGFVVPRSAWLPARLTLGLLKPRKKIPGMVLAGVVEAVGSAVQRFRPGDRVYAYDITRLSTYAEYACVPEGSAIAHIPAALSDAEAAALPFGGITALHFLRKANIRSGQHVLIYGASGSVGTAAVQLAKAFGAEVTAVASGANLGLVRGLGADHVIDYQAQDFTKNGTTYNIIFDTVGKVSRANALQSLRADGTFLLAVAGPSELIQMLGEARRSGRTMVGGTANPTPEALSTLSDMAQAGKIRPVIDRCYPLEQIVEAHRYVDQGHKKGNVVIMVGDQG